MTQTTKRRVVLVATGGGGVSTNTRNPNGDETPVTPDTAKGIACVVRAFTYHPIDDTLTIELRAVNPHAH